MQTNTKKTKERILPLAVTIISVPIIILIVLFFILRRSTSVMDWIFVNISSPVRGYLGLISSVFPSISLMEFLGTALALRLIVYIVKTIVQSLHRKSTLKFLAVKVAYILLAFGAGLCVFLWLWGSGYHGYSFAEKNGFETPGISVPQLRSACEDFLEKANRLSVLVLRDSDGHFAESRKMYFPASSDIFNNIVLEFPSLTSKQYAPKPMLLYSWLMSRTGFTGIYFALTGESNININAPACLIPATVAHELAHQRGVTAEDEANFIAVAACITSENPVFEYSGYLMGLIYLMDALHDADYNTWAELHSQFSPQLRQDWTDNYEYWQSQETETGIGKAVTAFYDGYLKSTGQELGLISYGKCIDLLVEWLYPQ